MKPPGKEILFQPMLVWEGSEPTYQGTGFFVKAPNGKIAAVTSAHFIERDGPPLQQVKWLDVKSHEPVATFSKSWGPPGHEGRVTITRIPGPDGSPVPNSVFMDQRSDYLLMPGPEKLPAGLVLELDPRTSIKPGERIWFHDKDGMTAQGYEIIEGSVVQAPPNEYTIDLDREIKPQSQSGSPVISQLTGKVIGTVAAIHANGGRVLYLTPSCSILGALKKDDSFPLLRDVIGKKSAQRPKNGNVGERPAASKEK
jgi:hypothetical protein